MYSRHTVDTRSRDCAVYALVTVALHVRSRLESYQNSDHERILGLMQRSVQRYVSSVFALSCVQQHHHALQARYACQVHSSGRLTFGQVHLPSPVALCTQGLMRKAGSYTLELPHYCNLTHYSCTATGTSALKLICKINTPLMQADR